MTRYSFKNINYLRIIVFFMVVTTCTVTGYRRCITNQVSKGGFGDNAIHYIKSKWLAHKYGLIFYLQPFDNVNFLTAFSQENVLSRRISRTFKKCIKISHESKIVETKGDEILFILEPYAQGFDFNTEDLINYLLLNSPQSFIDTMQLLLKPKNTAMMRTMEADVCSVSPKIITVAVHIRKPLANDYPLYGRQEFDTSHYSFAQEIVHITKNQSLQNQSLQKHSIPLPIKLSEAGIYSDVHEGPLKFPATQYYIDQIRELSEFLHDAPLFVQLFSNYSHSRELYDVIKKGVNKDNIIYDENSSHWGAGLIEDYYAMSQFDCLIKSQSSFSTISQLLGNHAIVIFPCECFWDDRKLIINKSTWLIRDQELSKIREKIAS